MLALKIRSRMVGLISKIKVKYYRFIGIEIGKGTFISLHAYIDVRRGKISIGNNVAIARGSIILGHTGFRPLKEVQETVIEDNVTIYVNSIIFPGVRIGKKSIIGAGSVVMKDVPSNVIVMGNPARVIKHLEEKE